MRSRTPEMGLQPVSKERLVMSLNIPNRSCSSYIFGNAKDDRSKNCSSAPC